VHGLGTVLAQMETWGITSGALGQAVAPAVTRFVFPIVTGATTVLVVAADLYAMCWFGLWMGLTSKSAHLAALKTIAFVWIGPWFVIAFASSLILGLLMVAVMMPSFTKGTTPNPTSLVVWYPLLTAVLTTFLSLGKDVFFAVWARRKLFSDFRELAVRAVAPVRLASPLVPTPPPIHESVGGWK